MKLSEYLAARGVCKALTKIEAQAFGVPYPLQAGWPRQYGGTEITAAMLDKIRTSAAGSKPGAAMRALRGVDAGMGAIGQVIFQQTQNTAAKPAPRILSAPSFHGFKLRG